MYDTEQEQIEAIKRWWATYGNGVIGGILVALIAYFGWLYYNNSVDAKQEAASGMYITLMDLVADADSDAGERLAIVDTLKSDYADTTYAVYAALQAAKDYVEQNDLAAAEDQLNWAASNSDELLQPVVQVRLARVQFARDNGTAALATLDSIEAEGYDLVINELRGDIHSAEGNADAAREAYRLAYEQAQQQGVESPYLKMKLDDLAATTDDA
ncbi:YfgM family protein [Saccharospirillum sp.]|uniref:YfgM family protein n=1 Tax=Saccharospirillum sp. TaxID=2033801 RepID=UPI0034A06E42